MRTDYKDYALRRRFLGRVVRPLDAVLSHSMDDRRCKVAVENRVDINDMED
jgi:hypothetical protein